ncbi:MAG: hypothetical protein HQM10_08885 [Candidatus Riflebacteria bacterium]|nr:hypothetical protein [Candidatus Riflebacteria bacterium]
MKRRNLKFIVILTLFFAAQFTTMPLMAADPTGAYLKELKVKKPGAGKVATEQIAQILLKVPVSDFMEVVWPFVNPPSQNLKWIETPAQLQEYFSKNNYAEYLKSELEYIDFSGLINKSRIIPCPIYNKARIIQAGGGFVMYNRHVFAEGYYRSKFNGDIRNTDNFYYLTKNQPWFEWTGKSYTLRKGQTLSAMLRYCAAKNGDVTLYRGAHPEEFDRFMKLREAGKSLKYKAKPVLKRATKCPDVFFLTPDKLKAFTWNKGIVEKITIPASVWQKWNDDSGVYIGIEYDYLEIAFYRDPALSFLTAHVEKLSEEEMTALQRESEAKQPPAGEGNVDNPDQ